VADLGAGAVDFCAFFVGASGCGHSTSWVRSRREAGIHSGRCRYTHNGDQERGAYHLDVC